MQCPSAPWLAFLAASLALAGCRTAAQPIEWTSPEAVVLDLPLVRQDELHECGLAALTALVRYWGNDLGAERRAELAALAEANEGLSGAQLRAALEAEGWEVWIYSGELAGSPIALRHQVDEGRPPLVMISPDGDTHHYCLVLGYDLTMRSVLLLDPRRGRIAMDEARFSEAWERSRRFTLLAVPPAAIPVQLDPPTNKETAP
jgi:ABC-type bacteriocin/lantibiotic exporter with double-glycine peptidase domain